MSRKKILLTLLSALVVGNVSALQNELVNPGFEKWQGNTPVGWELYSPNSHHKAEVKEVHGGSIAVVAEHHKDTPEFGLLQKIVYEKPTTKPILFGGWSKSAGITGRDDYNIFLDITYADGTNAYGIKSYWSNGSANWRHTFSCFRPEKPVVQINYYIFLRKGAAGKAYFDDFELYRGEPDVQIGTVKVESTAPVVEDGLFISTEFFRELSYKAVLKDADGKELLSQSGTGWGIRWDAAPPRKAAELEIQVSMGSKHKAYTCPINVNSELPENPVKGAYQIWTADSMTNISPFTYPPKEASCDVSLELAKAEGISVTEKDLEMYVSLIDSLNPDGMPSMRQDGLLKRPSEVELFSGTVIVRADAAGVPVPVNRELYRRIREMEAAYGRTGPEPERD